MIKGGGKEKNEHSIKIFFARPEDALGVEEVFYKTWLETYPNKAAGITRDDIEDMYKNAFTEEALQGRSEHIAHLPEAIRLVVAKDHGKVVGVCTAVKRADKNQLQAIYVLPEYQGCGIGTMLWQEAGKFFDPAKDTIVHVADYNVGAIKFYEKLGFVDSGKPHRKNERFKMKSGAMISEMEMVKKKEGEV